MAWMFAPNLFLPLMINMVIWFVIIKKEEIIDPILCTVLIVTNTNVIVHMFLLKYVVEIGSFALLGLCIAWLISV